MDSVLKGSADPTVSFQNRFRLNDSSVGKLGVRGRIASTVRRTR